ncbi:hypothetical protein D9615_009320 [Tricholomella constricta]|uniref:HAT C-terminal dimerisation domain-containing protein n=1 Tax=Tricholomella constricta TaxID=117010 RepID=A0A8H5GW13_9AGAR|nr:hypothetical protein D9615_009320 [Tricholomella constricta]
MDSQFHRPVLEFDDDMFPNPGDPSCWRSPQDSSSRGFHTQPQHSGGYSYPLLQNPMTATFHNPHIYPTGYQQSPPTNPSPYGHVRPIYHPGYNNPLQDTRSTTLNAAPAPTPATGRKRKAAQSSATQPRKRARKSATASGSDAQMTDSASIPLAAAHCGVGPSEIPSADTSPASTNAAPPPLRSFTAAAEETLDHGRENSKSAATDVWHFLRPLETAQEPEIRPDKDTEPILTKNPTKSPYVGCKLCKKWKTWKHQSGMTSCYRAHLKNKHLNDYEAVIERLGLKHSTNDRPASGTMPEHGPFSLETFYLLLMKWIVVDDQSLNVVECPELRELLNYLGNDKINDDDIPHRTKITQMIYDEHQKMRQQIMAELRKAQGLVSYTIDLWSDPNLVSYMAVTAHFYIRENGRLVLRTYLVAFRHVSGSHSGVNLANALMKIFDELGVAYRLALITMDNASNNNTMMEELEKILRSRGIPFDADGNRIRCFPHIINLACQAILEALKQTPALGLSLATESATRFYLQSLETDLIGTCRSVVAACRASGQRRQELRRIICEGNERDTWRGELPNDEKHLKVLQLLRDCETRWSSTYLMIDRIIYLYPAVQKFLLNIDQTDLSHHLFSDRQLNILRDIHQVLELPHAAQELLSAERTPTLSLSLPLYEILIEQWKLLQATIPELAQYIEVGIQKLEDYVGQARKTRIYAHAMVLNPSMKFEWMEKHWGNIETNTAREWIKESMLKYQRSLRREKTSQSRTVPLDRSLSAPSVAAHSQALGFTRLSGINVAVRRSTSMLTIPSQGPPSSSQPTPVPTSEEVLDQDTHKLIEDQRIVDQELRRYEDDGVTPLSERLEDLTRYWERHEHSYPLLFRISMDVLPAQASAVPCERVFSSSKETCTVRRSRLSPQLMEALQILKFSYKQERLSFTDDLLAQEEDYTIAGPVTSSAIAELTRTGRLLELDELLSNADAPV